MVDLNDKQAIVKFRAQERLVGLSAIQQIQEYYNGDIEITLPEATEEIRMRLQLIIRLQSKQLSRFNIIKKVSRVFEVSERQAYRDYENALKVFGDVHNSGKNGKRVVVEEMLSTSYRNARAAGNTKQMIEASKALMKLNGLDREDVEKPDFSNLKQSVYVVIMPPEVDQLFDTFIKSSGSIDVSQFINNIAENAEEASYTEGGSDHSDQGGD